MSHHGIDDWQKMIQMLRSLEERFPQIIAISHNNDVQGQFDNTLPGFCSIASGHESLFVSLIGIITMRP
jgi:hypothetical protein